MPRRGRSAFADTNRNSAEGVGCAQVIGVVARVAGAEWNHAPLAPSLNILDNLEQRRALCPPEVGDHLNGHRSVQDLQRTGERRGALNDSPAKGIDSIGLDLPVVTGKAKPF